MNKLFCKKCNQYKINRVAHFDGCLECYFKIAAHIKNEIKRLKKVIKFIKDNKDSYSPIEYDYQLKKNHTLLVSYVEQLEEI
jgi:hypothetical protein